MNLLLHFDQRVRTRVRTIGKPAGILVLLTVASLGLMAQSPPQDLHTPEGQYRFAEGLFFRQFYDLAEKEFRAFGERFPDHALAADAMYRLILCLRHQKKEDEMLRAIDPFQAKWPTHDSSVKLYLWKGELLLGRGDCAGAETCFRRLITHPDTVTAEAAVYFVAQCVERQGKADEALALYKQLADRDLDAQHEYRPYALYALAVADQRRVKNDSAAQRFQRLVDAEVVPKAIREEAMYRLAEARFALEAYDDAIRHYERLLAEFPDGAFGREARKRLSWACYLKGDCKRAVESAAEWRRRYPDAVDAEVDLIHAASMVGLEMCAEALPLLTRLAEGTGVTAETVRMARYQEIVCLANLNRYEDAIAKADAFAAAYPKAAELAMVQYMAGRACHGRKEWEKAATYLRRAVDNSLADASSGVEAGRLLADSLLKLNRPVDAAAVFRALSARQGVQQAPYYLFKAGECERQAGNAAAAIRDFEALIQTFPQAVAETRAALQHLGELYSSAGQVDRAVGIVRALIEKATTGADRARLRFYLGYLRYQQRTYEEAITELRAVIAAPDAGSIVPAARFYLGSSLLEAGHRDEALDTFAAALALPVKDRPPFPADLLLQLEPLYFARNQADLSETICRWLMEGDNLMIVQRGTLRLASLLAAQNRFEAAEAQLATLRRRRQEASAAPGTAAVLPPDEEITALQAELFLRQDKVPQAVVAAEQCLACKDLDDESLTRARWVLAEALVRQGHPMQALPYAVKAYILDDDPTYSPRAMALALRLLVEQKRMAEAQTTWAELLKRYPVFAETLVGTADVKAVLDMSQTEAPKPPERKP